MPDTGTDAGPGRDPPDQARLRQLVDEQAALRRVATLVASGAQPAEVFSAVADENMHKQLLAVDELLEAGSRELNSISFLT